MTCVHSFWFMKAFQHLPVCPDVCSCIIRINGEMTTDCTGRGLTEIPEGIPESSVIILLQQNNITNLRNTTFSKMTDLRVLNLEMNNIHSIEEGTFNNLTNLEHLDLSENHISDTSVYENVIFRNNIKINILNLTSNNLTKVHPSLLRSITSINTLYMAYNQIDSIDDDAFVNCTQLKHLDLDGNHLNSTSLKNVQFPSSLSVLFLCKNKFTYLEENFLTLPSLTVLIVSGNQISDININAFSSCSLVRYLFIDNNNFTTIPVEALKKLDMLAVLHMSANNITHISGGTFQDFTALKAIALRNCPVLKRIDKHAFSGLPSLRVLSISHNHLLEYIDPESFVSTPLISMVHLNDNKLQSLNETLLPWSRMSSISLHDNPWHCDCSISWLQELAIADNSKPYKRFKRQPKCQYPEQSSGQYIQDQTMSECTAKNNR